MCILAVSLESEYCALAMCTLPCIFISMVSVLTAKMYTRFNTCIAVEQGYLRRYCG